MCAMEAHATQSLLQVYYPALSKVNCCLPQHKQEDAPEFLMVTLNDMHISYLLWNKHLESSSEDSTLTHGIFGGAWRSQMNCFHLARVPQTPLTPSWVSNWKSRWLSM